MESYQLGKDMQEIVQRLDAIEKKLGAKKSCGCISTSSVTTLAIDAALFAAAPPPPRVWVAGRMDAGECECREQTLTISSDGRFTHVAVHNNHSGGLDDGDEHRLTIHILAGDQIVHSFGSERFVPRQRDRTEQVDGQSQNIKNLSLIFWLFPSTCSVLSL